MITTTVNPLLAFGLQYLDGSGYPQVNTYADLPDPVANAGLIYVVLTPTGIYILNRKEAGMYYSDGASWSRLGNIPSFFSSNTFQIYDAIDSSKNLRFNVSAISTNTFRTISMPDADVNLGLISTSFQQGGNSFGTTATLGTNDNNPLVFRTNTNTVLTLDTSKDATFVNNIKYPSVVVSSGREQGVIGFDGTNKVSFFGSHNNPGGTSYLFFRTNRGYDGLANTTTGYVSTRAGGSLQLENESLVYYQFAASSTTAVEAFRINTSGNVVAVGTVTGLSLIANTGSTTAATNAINVTNTTFNPTSGSNSYTNLLINPTYNQTSSANGVLRGVYYNPTTTGILGEHYSYYSTSGKALFSGSAGPVPATTFSLTSGATTSGSATITYTSNTVVKAGDSITGTGIPANTTIKIIISDTSAVLSANATATNSALTFTITPTLIGAYFNHTLEGAANSNQYGLYINPQFTNTGTGNRGLYISNSYTAGSSSIPLEINNQATENSLRLSGGTIGGAAVDFYIGRGGLLNNNVFGLIYNGSAILSISNTTTLGVAAGVNLVSGNGLTTFSIGGGFGSTAAGYAFSMYSSGAVSFGGWSNTSGASGFITIGTSQSSQTFAPTSGAATFAGINLGYTINQTGTASGILRGIYYNPTTTGVLGEHFAFQSTSGKLAFSGSSGPYTTSYSLTSGATTNASKTITYAANTTLKQGDVITGSNIPTNSFVTEIISSTSAKINQNATGTGSSITFTVIPILAGASLMHSFTTGNNDPIAGLYINPSYSSAGGQALNRSLIVVSAATTQGTDATGSTAIETICNDETHWTLIGGPNKANNIYRIGVGYGANFTSDLFYISQNNSLLIGASTSSMILGTNMMLQGGASATSFSFGGGGGSTNALFSFTFNSPTVGGSGWTATSGNCGWINIMPNSTYVHQFNPSSGTATFTGLQFGNYVINQTGTATGTIRGIYYNPTVTAVLGTHNAWESTAGHMIVGGTGSVGIGGAINGSNPSRLQIYATSTYAAEFDAQKSSTGTNTDAGIIIANTNATTNNRAGILFCDASFGTGSGAVGFTFTDRTNHYGSFHVTTQDTDGIFDRLTVDKTGLTVNGTGAIYLNDVASGNVIKKAFDNSAASTLRIGGVPGTDFSTVLLPSNVTWVGAANFTNNLNGTFSFTFGGGNTGLNLNCQTSANAGSESVNIVGASGASFGTANKRALQFNGTWANTSSGGTASFTGIEFIPTLNQNPSTGSPLAWSCINLNPTITNIKTTLYGLRSQLAANPTGGGVSWNIYADGTAPNKFGGATYLPTVTKTANYTATTSDYTIRCNGVSAGFTITLPAAASFYDSTTTTTGGILVIKKTDTSGNTITIQANGAENIDGSNTKTLTSPYAILTLQSNGTSWDII